MNIFRYILLTLSIYCMSSISLAVEIPTTPKSERSILNVEATLKKELVAKGLKYGAPIFIRIFKDPGVLEIWLEASKQGEFVLFKTYEICAFSGGLGPKLKEGDNKSPEGFYFVTASSLNPWSSYHLSFNLGYPNEYDRSHGRTGSALMVHGKCVSIGCYAMTDAYMNEIYALSVAALKGGQPFFRVHAFPFHLHPSMLEKYKSSQWFSFWKNLKVGYDHFNKFKRPPNVNVTNGVYIFGSN